MTISVHNNNNFITLKLKLFMSRLVIDTYAVNVTLHHSDIKHLTSNVVTYQLLIQYQLSYLIIATS